MKKMVSLFVFFLGALTLQAQQILEVPGLDEFAKIDTNGRSVLPSGRYVTPAGKTMIRYNRTIDWRKIKKTVEMDDEEDQRKNH